MRAASKQEIKFEIQIWFIACSCAGMEWRNELNGMKMNGEMEWVIWLPSFHSHSIHFKFTLLRSYNWQFNLWVPEWMLQLHNPLHAPHALHSALINSLLHCAHACISSCACLLSFYFISWNKINWMPAAQVKNELRDCFHSAPSIRFISSTHFHSFFKKFIIL